VVRRHRPRIRGRLTRAPAVRRPDPGPRRRPAWWDSPSAPRPSGRSCHHPPGMA
jgi:hypothetical protein